jgi:hypothetical protein
MKITCRKTVSAATKFIAMAAVSLCAAVLMGGCPGGCPDVVSTWSPPNEPFDFVFTDETGRIRAEIRSEESIVVHCLDDTSVWNMDFGKSLDREIAQSRGRPASSPATYVLTDEHGQIVGVLRQDIAPWEIHPLNTGSVWKLDMQKSRERHLNRPHRAPTSVPTTSRP